jgi:hypothetical protein
LSPALAVAVPQAAVAVLGLRLWWVYRRGLDGLMFSSSLE